MWSTADEISFINGIGSYHNPHAVVSMEERLEYLKRYLEGLALRVNWGNLDADTIIKYTVTRIEYYDKHLTQNRNHK